MPSHKQIDLILRAHSKTSNHPEHRLSKRSLLAFFQNERSQQSSLWRSLALTDEQAEDLVRLLRAKPRRTASGVATVTVLTKPWPCGNDCVYCPNDVRMPKSYLADEPACQRAERCYFDPYLQMAARLQVLHAMGHNTDKVEVIVLGGTWLDYPEAYRLWFMCQLFKALNEFDTGVQDEVLQARWDAYEYASRAARQDVSQILDEWQARINEGCATYSEAFAALQPLREQAMPEFSDDACTWEELERLHQTNETAHARCVGLVVETRPETVTIQTLLDLRRLGVTKLQIGIQTLDDTILSANNRQAQVADTKQALALMRLCGFKSHIHMMANLKGATPESDVQHYSQLVTNPAFLPDEVKLYPCALVESSRLTDSYKDGSWQPYDEGVLIALLADCITMTPPFTRISRMIRDIPSDDILCGSKKTNLRQLVELHVDAKHGLAGVQEMRIREVATDQVQAEDLQLKEIAYKTSNTEEYFLQWVTGTGKLAGFLRLSLPHTDAVASVKVSAPQFPICPHEAMIREVHVYGRTSKIHESAEGNQHVGLGRALVERACCIAGEHGFAAINVISAVGTRAYYRKLGFSDAGLYQKKQLERTFNGS